MSERAVFAVARWEYRRFAKRRDLLMGILFFMVMFGLFGFVGHVVERKSSEPRDIAVWGALDMGLDGIENLDRFRLLPKERDPEALEAAVVAEEFDALLLISGPDQAELLVRGESGWQQEFLVLLASHIQTLRLAEGGIDPQLLAALVTPPDIRRVEVGSQEGGQGRAQTKTVLIVVGTMLLGLFLGFSYVFVAITGEKTQRVTESVLSTITPQEWIDGKILGLTMVVVINVICYCIGYLLYKLAALIFFGAAMSLPSGVGDPVTVMWLILYSCLGFGFWFTFFAMVAATINDPNSSSRSSFMMLPFLPMALSLIGMDQPDAFWMRILALLPGISPTAMPVRLMRGSPSTVEIAISLMALAAMVWVFRRTAGRIFGTSMLMTGKEPSLGEVWRWAKES